MRFSTISFGALLLAAATPAMAQDDPAATAPDPAAAAPATTSAFKVTGGATLTSDYRFRGISQTFGDGAAQGTININHSSGFYVGTWASTINDRKGPLVGYGSAEVDLYGGYTKTLKSGIGFDVGLLYYYYIDATLKNTDFFEPYAAVMYTLGPVSTKLGAAYAWGGQSGLNYTSGNDDNIYVYGEASVGVPKTPITLKGHLGYTNGSLGLVNANPKNDHYFDWSATAEAVGGPLKVGVSYVDTSITSKHFPDDFRGEFAQHFRRGWTVLGYVGVSF